MNAPFEIFASGARPAHGARDGYRYKLNVTDYVLLDKAGSLSGLQTELVEGEIRLMSPEWRPHFRIKSELAYRLRRAVEEAGLTFFVGTEGSVAISPNDMPRPDVLLTDAAEGDGPVPCASIPLLVEISTSTLDEDLGPKAAKYAAAGIPEYWVVDANGREIHRFWKCDKGVFTEHDKVEFGQVLTSATLSNVGIATSAL